MNTAMIGDRMDTDIVAGMEAGMHTILVMTGVSSQASISSYPFRPNRIIDGVYELLDEPLDIDSEDARGSDGTFL